MAMGIMCHCRTDCQIMLARCV